MSKISFVGGTMILADRLITGGSLTCDEGIITEIQPSSNPPTEKQGADSDSSVIDLTDRYLCPGFVDLHVHGGAGADFMDGTLDSTLTACKSHLSHGTTTIFPTTSTGRPEQLRQMIQTCQQLMNETAHQNAAKIGGVHLYGPYFAKDKSGCHLDTECREPTANEFDQYFDSGIIRIATCAAELPGAIDFYKRASEHECLITCGHSNASWTQMQLAYDHGMRHVDHFWCAMSSVSSVRKEHGFPMQGSMLEFVLGNPEMSTEVIADGQHLSPELLQFAWQMKSSNRLCLVTDCNRALDMPPGNYRFGCKDDGAWFESNGEVGLASPDALASSIRGMDHMVQTMLNQTQVPLVDVIRMATLTPAERVKRDSQIGSLEVGKVADLLVLDQEFNIEKVFLGGEEMPKLV